MSAITNALFLAATARAAFQGFNYGNVFTDGRLKEQSDFEAEFKTAQGLEGTNGAFNSARLYTMIQGDSDGVIEAIPAAIETKTSLLLGLWASAGSEAFDKELAALEKAISQHGDDLGSLVAGISVGSEDLYRNSPVGIEAGEFAGTDPDTLVDYINKVRDVLKDTPLSKAKVGHVDTWTAFANNSNSALIEACDWLGMDAYPYFEDTHPNAVSNGGSLFRDALRKTQGAAGDKEVWITETGWPVSGKTVGSAEPSIENAEKFWKDVGCPMFGETNVWWYTLQDAAPDTPNPSFGIVEETGGEPLYDLSCEGVSKDDSNDDDSSASEGDAGSSDGSGNGDDSDDSESGSGSEDSSGDSGAGSESGSNSGNTDADSSETDDAEEDDEGISGSHQLNSIGASVVAILGAMALL